MSHTPGPWNVTWEVIEKIGPEPIATIEYGDNGFYENHRLSVSGIIRKEDASLIAAAPDLLAVLEVIVKETMDNPPAPPYSADSYLPPHLIEQAQAAIKKARGEA